MSKPGAKKPKITGRTNRKEADVEVDVGDDMTDLEFLREVDNRIGRGQQGKRVFFRGRNMLLNQIVVGRLAKCATKHGYGVTFTIQKNDPLNIPTLFQLGIDSTIEESDGS